MAKDLAVVFAVAVAVAFAVAVTFCGVARKTNNKNIEDTKKTPPKKCGTNALFLFKIIPFTKADKVAYDAR